MKASLKSSILTATLLAALFSVTKLSGAVLDLNGVTRVSDGNGGYTYPTWKPMLGPGGGYALTDSSGYLFDPLDDQQTGQNQSDFASQAGQPGFLIQFGTINGIEHVGFRILMNEFHPIATVSAANQSSGGTGTNSDISIGLDGDLDGTTDIFIRLNQTNNKEGITFQGVGTGTNTSPNTTTWTNIFYPGTAPTETDPAKRRLATSILNPSSGGTVLSFDGTAPTAGNGQNLTNWELNATNIPLYYPGWTTKAESTRGTAVLDSVISFAVPVADLNAALVVQAQGFSISSTSFLRWVAVTATQANAINQDAYGAAKITNQNDPLFSSFSVAMNGSGSPVPEPGTYGLLLGSGLSVLYFFKRRGLRPSGHAKRDAS